jgi:diguanylate cyclase (GGDEF)-like protein
VIVVHSALDQPAVVAAALEAGADDFVSKSAEADEFAARIRAALRTRRRLVELARSNRRLDAAASHDSLTGLPNRALLADRFAQMIVQARRRGAQLGVLFVDLDEFKLVNDSLGHAGGDEVLRRFAAILKTQLRAADALARWGGEEFLLLMPGTRLDDARVVLDRLRHAVHATGEFGAIAADLKVTFSAGLVEVGEGESQDAALERADRALYQAKERGRNRIEVGEDLTVEAQGTV